MLSALYLSFQTLLNEWLQPVVERIFRKKYPHVAKLKSIDLMHFGWNIGNQFKKSGVATSTFVKRVFAKPLEKVEISTISRKLKDQGTCIIKIKENR